MGSWSNARGIHNSRLLFLINLAASAGIVQAWKVYGDRCPEKCTEYEVFPRYSGVGVVLNLSQISGILTVTLVDFP